MPQRRRPRRGRRSVANWRRSSRATTPRQLQCSGTRHWSPAHPSRWAGRDANHDPRTGNGGRRWPNTAAGTAAYTNYLETGFYSQLKEFDDDCLRACALVLAACHEGGTHQSIVQHADYAALVYRYSSIRNRLRTQFGSQRFPPELF